MSRVLLVDDDIDLCIIVADSLMDEHEIDTANDGKAAAQSLSSNQYDLIILDWDLPHISGVELCQSFRANGGTTPVLMLTGRDNVSNKEEGFDAGADDYMTKPFDLRELSARVKAMLRRSATNKAIAKEEVKSIVSSPGMVRIGDVVADKYRIEQFIGEGGMAAVYKATHLVMNKPVVIKVLHQHLLRDETSLKRFEVEYKLLAQISHPNVVDIYDVGWTANQQPYLVMEYIKGQSLRNVIEVGQVVPLAAALRILMHLCAGLQEAHNAGIIHRDIKPENVLLGERSDRHDWVKLVDFGIAHLTTNDQRLTDANCVVGTAEYIAPEQLTDATVDARLDIYALGVLFYEMVTGEVPFSGKTVEAIFRQHLNDKPVHPSKKRAGLMHAGDVDRIALRALEKHPADRYQTVGELKTDLERLVLKKV
jgi:serine/threonine protein kinase/CheY-like chemotaxis protein